MRRTVNDLPDLVRDLLRRAEVSYPDRSHRIWDIWEDAVGPEVARRSRPAELRRGTLTVAVESAPWMQQLSFLREQIRDALNRALGQDVVRQVRFRNAPLERLPPPRSLAPPPAWLSEPLDAAGLAAIEEELSEISDPALRDLLRPIRVRAEQARRHRGAPADPRPPASSGRGPRGGEGEP